MVLMWSLRSRSYQGHSYFKVKVILESNGNVFQFLSQSEWLAFVRMLTLLVRVNVHIYSYYMLITFLVILTFCFQMAVILLLFFDLLSCPHM